MLAKYLTMRSPYLHAPSAGAIAKRKGSHRASSLTRQRDAVERGSLLQGLRPSKSSSTRENRAFGGHFQRQKSPELSRVYATRRALAGSGFCDAPDRSSPAVRDSTSENQRH